MKKTKKYEAIKDKIDEIIEEEFKEIECTPCDEGEDEFSHKIRKMHYKAEAKALRLRLHEAFTPKPVTAHYEPANGNGPEQHYYECPACYSEIASIHDSTAWTKKFCPYCGQPLDWSGLGFDMSEKSQHNQTLYDSLIQSMYEKADKIKKMPIEEFAANLMLRVNNFDFISECPLFMEYECNCDCNSSYDDCLKKVIKRLEEKII